MTGFQSVPYHSNYSNLTILLLVTNLANTKWCKKSEKWLKPWHMGTHLRVLSISYPMDTNMTGFRWFSKNFASLWFGRKQPQHWKVEVCVYAVDSFSLASMCFRRRSLILHCLLMSAILHPSVLSLMLQPVITAADDSNQPDNDHSHQRNPGTWVLIWEYLGTDKNGYQHDRV